MSLGVASSLFLLVAIEVSTARSRTAGNRLPMENGYRPQGRKILQVRTTGTSYHTSVNWTVTVRKRVIAKGNKSYMNGSPE